MIVELTGVSGSGKSTIYNKLISDVDNVIFVSNSGFNIFNEIYLFSYFVFNIFKTLKYMHLFKIILTSKNTFVHKINIIRNTIKKISKYMIYNNKKGIFFFDEGISHISFNLFVDDSSSNINKKELENLIELLPIPNMLFIIVADKSLILNRLQNRGHNRVKLDDLEKTKIFINKSFEVKEIMLDIFRKKIKVFEIFNNDIDNTKVVEKIKLELKEINV